jgi:HAD superfamily phosphatase (TIGR01681 family)
MEGKTPVNLKMVIFDLDGTLQFNSIIEMPTRISDIITFFRKNNVIICLASLNRDAEWFLSHHNLLHLFDAIEKRQGYRNCSTIEEKNENKSLKKNLMFKRLMAKFNVQPEQMLFFDDYVYNILDARNMKIKSVMVNPSKLITWTDVREGLCLFNKHTRRYSFP